MIRVIALVLFAAAVFAVVLAGPALSIDNTTFDGGPVAEGSKVKAVFKFTNTGNEPLRITSVRPGCGCTVVKYDSVIAPGRTGVLEPAVDLKGMRAGYMSRGVHVTTNAANTPTLNLTIAATIVAHVEVSESYLAFEGAARRSVFLTSARKDLKVSGITFKPHHSGGGVPGWAADVPLAVKYSFAVTDSVSADGRKVYRLDIEPPPAGSEPVSGQFGITTNHPDKREISIGGTVQ